MQQGKRSNEIEVQTPCPKSWEGLVGDERRRYCSECELHVHNSAALTRAEAHELVRDAQERVCMRVVRDASGAPVYLDSCGTGGVSSPDMRDGGKPIRSLPRAAGWVLAAGAALLSACQDEPTQDPQPGGDPVEVQQHPVPAQPTPDEVMGVVAPAPPELLGEVALPDGCDAEPDAEVGSLPECGEDESGCGTEAGPATPPEVLGRVALPSTETERPK